MKHRKKTHKHKVRHCNFCKESKCFLRKKNTKRYMVIILLQKFTVVMFVGVNWRQLIGAP